MSLIILLVTLGIVLFWQEGASFRKFSWFQAYIEKLNSFLAGQQSWQAELRYLIILLPIPVALWLILILFQGLMLSVLTFIVSTIALWFSFQQLPVERDYEEYFAAVGARDEQAIRNSATKLLPNANLEQTTYMGREITAHMFIQAHQAIFAVIFWFLILGPAGAIAYRLIIESQKLSYPEIAAVAKKWQSWLDFIPTRLLSLSFSLMGNFIAVMGCLRSYLHSGVQSNDALLSQSGLAAIGVNIEANASDVSMDEHQESIYLIHRALIAWLVVISLMVVVHWLS